MEQATFTIKHREIVCVDGYVKHSYSYQCNSCQSDSSGYESEERAVKYGNAHLKRSHKTAK